MSDWTWDADEAIYRHLDGAILNADDLRELRDQFASNIDDLVIGIMGLLIAKDGGGFAIDPGKMAEWETRMRGVIQDDVLALYLLGRGGIAAMTITDWNRAGNMVRNLFSYLNRFARELKMGLLSVDASIARARMYAGAGVYAFERGRQAAYGVPRLPGYPGQGTSCLSNCRCSWRIKKIEGGWEASWMLEPGIKHCNECLNRSTAWARLVIKA